MQETSKAHLLSKPEHRVFSTAPAFWLIQTYRTGLLSLAVVSHVFIRCKIESLSWSSAHSQYQVRSQFWIVSFD